VALVQCERQKTSSGDIGREVVPPLNIFLDDGGVITDKQRRAAEFGRLVGDYFVPLLGGTEEAWARAHHTVVDRLADPQSMGVLTTADFVSFYRAYQLHWVAGMCELLDLPTPPEEERLDLAYRALGWITRRIQAALPGAVEAIHLLHRHGYALHTASGSCSLELAGSCEGMGVRHCFRRLYGADLVNTFKEGPEYYEHLFADVGVQPEEALVVDDSAEALDWAASLGARTILVSASPHPETGATRRLGSLAELPAFLRQWV
jgi:HAD superfamily hydrolase (TIGR01509 family)